MSRWSENLSKKAVKGAKKLKNKLIGLLEKKLRTLGDINLFIKLCTIRLAP